MGTGAGRGLNFGHTKGAQKENKNSQENNDIMPNM